MNAFDRDGAAQTVRANLGSVKTAMASMAPFTINGRTWTASDLIAILVIDPGYVDVAAAQCAAWVSFWGITSADAKRAYDVHEAEYRIARDTWALRRRVEGGKVTKDALEEEWRTQPSYLQWYTRKGELERAWSCAQFCYDAFGKQATMLSALSRMYVEQSVASAARYPTRT